MAFNLKVYKIFIASPSSLTTERKAFKTTIEEYNLVEANSRGVLFQAIGWEDTLAGIGRPQGIINKELLGCDYFVMVLHDRWGSYPGKNEKNATSGTEEEYKIALECVLNNNCRMKQVVALFKAIPPIKMSYPDKELKKVLKFRKHLEKKRILLYTTYSSKGEFINIIRKHLASWLRNSDDDQFIGGITKYTPLSPSDLYLNQISNTQMQEQRNTIIEENVNPLEKINIDKAWDLANKGQLVRAEIEFSKALISQPNVFQTINYSIFLQRIGKLAQAKSLIDKALVSVTKSGNLLSQASLLTQKGHIYRTQGLFYRAEKMYKSALEINEKFGKLEGVANQFGNLGIIYRTQGNVDKAELMYRKSLEINEKIRRPEGIASNLGNLGNILKTRGDLIQAESLFRKALEINEKIGRLEGLANQYGNLGIVLNELGNIVEAEKMFRKSLEINKKLGRLEGIANQYSNLGIIYKSRKEFSMAEEMYTYALNINKRLGRLEGIAIQYGNLGNLLIERNQIIKAEQMFKKALAIDEKLGKLESIAKQYANLGKTLKIKRDLAGAIEMYNKSMKIAISGGFRSIASLARISLRELNKKKNL